MPETLEALGIFVLFFVPGFVATQVYVRNDPTADASQPKTSYRSRSGLPSCTSSSSRGRPTF